MNNHSKATKIDYLKIISDYLNIKSDDFKTEKCILGQPNRDGLTVEPSHLRISLSSL